MNITKLITIALFYLFFVRNITPLLYNKPMVDLLINHHANGLTTDITYLTIYMICIYSLWAVTTSIVEFKGGK
jgi:peptidoglycan biosynthesis protein MviN/MurJ (putative lipid II flippase)